MSKKGSIFQRQRGVRYLIIVFIALVLFIAPPVIYAHYQVNNIIAETNQEISNSLVAQSELFDDEISKLSDYLTSVDKHITRDSTTSLEDIMAQYNKYVVAQYMGYPVVVSSSGFGYYQNENGELKHFDVAEISIFQQSLLNLEELVSNPFLIDGKVVVCVYHPLYNADGSLTTYIGYFMTSEYMEKYLNYNDVPSGQTIITDKTGRVILTQNKPDDLLGRGDILGADFILHYEDSVTGVMAYSSSGDYYASADKVVIGNNSWYFVSITSKTVMRHYAWQQISGMLIVAALYCAFLIALALLWFYRTSLLNDKIYRLAYIDDVTQRDNKAAFVEHYEEAMHSKINYILVSLSIATFRAFNDTFGFSKGNILLKTCADVINDNLYAGETFCRDKSNHFYLLLKYTDEDEIQDRIYQISRDLEVSKEKAGIVASTPLEFGAVVITDRFTNFNSYAEYANYTKDSKKGNFYRGQIKDNYELDAFVKQNITKSIENNELVVYLQGMHDLNNGRYCGAEALIRWKPKSKKQIFSPAQFIGVAEQTGFIAYIDLYVVEEVSKLIATWNRQHKALIPVSVNFSEFTLGQRDIAYKINEILDRYKVDHSLLQVEINESVIEANPLRYKTIIEQLHLIGVKVAIDDFGSGCSSFRMLKTTNVDCVKIDQSFLVGDYNTTNNRAILQRMLQIVGDLDVRAVVEGVETQGQVNFLLEIGYTYCQGFFFTKALSLYDFERHLMESRRTRKTKKKEE